jgi:hypothetical protein
VLRTHIVIAVVAVLAIVGVGSLAAAVEFVSDEIIHLQDTDGKIQTNVPVAASRAFSPLPVQFDPDLDTQLDSDGDGVFDEATDDLPKKGSSIKTTQKAVINLVLDTSEDASVRFRLNNLSEDNQIFLFKVAAPSNVIIDVEGSIFITIHGLVGHNEWLADISTGCNVGISCTILIEVSTTDAGMYPIAVELVRVG